MGQFWVVFYLKRVTLDKLIPKGKGETLKRVKTRIKSTYKAFNLRECF